MTDKHRKTCWDCLAEVLEEAHAESLADSLRLTRIAQARMSRPRPAVRKGDDARRRKD